MIRCTPEERILCAKHEATHLIFAVILDAWIIRVGIPRADGRPPHNPIRRCRRSAHMGYTDCTHNNSGLDGFISLVGYSFEKAHGDPDRAVWDYEDAKKRIAPEALEGAEILAAELISCLQRNIDAVADQLMAKARKDGKIESKLKKIVESIEDELGADLYRISNQIKRCCETKQ